MLSNEHWACDVVHVNASSKLSEKLSANLEQHSTETECSAKCLRMSFKDYRRNELRYGEQSGLLKHSQ